MLLLVALFLSPIQILCFVAYLVASGFTSVFLMAVDTVFICFRKLLYKYHIVEMFGSVKVWRIWQMVRASPNFNQPYKWYPYGRNLFTILILLNTFDSAIHQTLTLPNIPAIWYSILLQTFINLFCT